MASVISKSILPSKGFNWFNLIAKANASYAVQQATMKHQSLCFDLENCNGRAAKAGTTKEKYFVVGLGGKSNLYIQ